jgi:hypothetical protein
MSDETREAYAKALARMLNELDEWKNAGAPTMAPVGAIQEFIHAICAQREEIFLEALIAEGKSRLQ